MSDIKHCIHNEFGRLQCCWCGNFFLYEYPDRNKELTKEDVYDLAAAPHGIHATVQPLRVIGAEDVCVTRRQVAEWIKENPRTVNVSS